jgi:hypothetical protein
MPRWFLPIWNLAGKVDDVLGRLRVIRNGAVIVSAVTVIAGILLVNAFGPWGATLFVVAVAALMVAIVDHVIYVRSAKRPEEPSPDDPAVEEAMSLVEELRAFYLEQQKALPPLDLIVVGRSPPGALEAWQAARDAEVVADFRRVFEPRVIAAYEALRARRGYGHPMMEGRYNDVRRPGEILTIAIAFADIVGVPWRPPPPPGGVEEAPVTLGQELLALSRRIDGWLRDRLRTEFPPRDARHEPTAVQNRIFDERMTRAFREEHLLEFQRLYDRATARGFVDERLEKFYDGPTSTGDMDLFIKHLRELAARLNRVNREVE